MRVGFGSLLCQQRQTVRLKAIMPPILFDLILLDAHHV